MLDVFGSFCQKAYKQQQFRIALLGEVGRHLYLTAAVCHGAFISRCVCVLVLIRLLWNGQRGTRCMIWFCTVKSLTVGAGAKKWPRASEAEVAERV